MNAAAYHEPHRVPAGVLALVVHSVFFALLYFGFNWNRQVLSTPSMSVELWSSLPEATAAQPAAAKVEVVVPPQPPQRIVEPDIVMPDKKKAVAKPDEAKPEKMKPVPKTTEAVKPKPEEKKPAEQNADAQNADKQAALDQAERAKQDEQAAAIGKVVDEYKAKIQSKIRSKIIEPQNVAISARAEFMVTLLPGGVVLNTKLIKSSGNAAYDDAVERAILKSDPLPVPPDVQLFNRFRELDLVFKPETN
jgi:colicin import membrane protein